MAKFAMSAKKATRLRLKEESEGLLLEDHTGRCILFHKKAQVESILERLKTENQKEIDA